MRQPSWPLGLALAALGVGGAIWTAYTVVTPMILEWMRRSLP